MPSSRLIKDPVRYKTVLCEKFLANGECPYGHKCQFAHGTHELRERGEKKEKKEKKPKRSRAEEEAAEPTCSLCTPPPAAPARRAASPPPAPARPPALDLRLPPGLGISESAARKAVTWGPEVVSATPPPSPSLPPCSQLPSPSTPPWTGENEPPQLSRSDSGVQPKVGINSVTGKVELTRVSRQASHNTDTVRRQLSLLFSDDDPDDIAAAPTSSMWRHDHFGMPVGAV